MGIPHPDGFAVVPPHEGREGRPINIVSVRVGGKYTPDYVAILHDMAARNLSTRPQRHWCVTDDPAALPEGVEAIAADPSLPGWWQKIHLFSPAMPFEAGARILYLDLDVAITGRLEDLADAKGIARDAAWPCYNSSVMVWDHGEHGEVWERFDRASIGRPGAVIPRELLPAGQVNGGDQEWLTEVGGWNRLPSGWCVSYRFGEAQDWPPAECKVVLFHGQPKPHEVKGSWVEQVWKIGGFTSLAVMKGANVPQEQILAQVAQNSARDLPWFTGFGDQKRACVLVCGGPSLAGRLADIRAHRRAGAKIVCVNNALRFLVENGIRPDAHVMLDARPENAAFVADAPAGIRYFIASQCHPAVFEALSARQVVVWHNAIGDGQELRETLAPWWDEKPVVMVPGGCTVGLRALHMAWLSGYRRVHVYGMDGAFSGPAHHAYDQALNDGDKTLRIVMGSKAYVCALWMVRQAEDFRSDYQFLTDRGMRIQVHGEGLIPDMAQRMRFEARVAA